MQTTPLQIGKYEVIKPLRQGGMGILYLARDPRLDRSVVIKMIRADVDSAELRERFQQEAQAASRMRHPNIITIFDYGEFEAQPYVVMEYIEGESLAALIAKEVPLSFERKLRMMEDVCTGMAHVHDANMVHRDLKPDNLMVDGDRGRVKILDFGIARSMEAGPCGFTSGIGTPSYMAPEQITTGTVDRRSDIFAMGAILYELLTSRRAFNGSTSAEIVNKILHEQPLRIEQLSTEVDARVIAIVTKALAKAPADRYQTADDFRAALQSVRSAAHETQVSSSRQLLVAAGVSALLIAGHGILPESGIGDTLFRLPFVSNAVTSVRCAIGYVEACIIPGVDYESDEALYQEACDRGSLMGCYNLAVLYDSDDRLLQDPARAVPLYKKACDGGIFAACNNLGVLHANGDGGLAKDTARAVVLYQQACDGGNAIACTNLGVYHYDGEGGSAKEAPRAAALHQKSCDGGSAMGCYNLGVLYANGADGVAKDVARAVALYQQACDGGFAEGCFNLGILCEDGDPSFAKDLIRAVGLYAKACDGGVSEACNNLGLLHANGGIGVTKDLTRAAALFRQACEGSSANGCGNLALYKRD